MSKTEWKEHYREERLTPKLRKLQGHFIGFQQQSNTGRAGYAGYTAGHKEEGSGRAHRAGGSACDYCPYCSGSADWCPVLD